ncbi:hypothetical protein J6590_069608 [Homalodisca vitripennis]|nr:hypothetical protein J6590_069608 [Homalodisca vitripennis]
MMEMRSFPPLPASAAVNLSSDQQVMDVETGDSLDMEDDALNMPQESSESVVDFRKKMSERSSESDGLEGESFFTSEEIMREMGFNNSLIKRAAKEMSECTNTQIKSGPSGLSRCEHKESAPSSTNDFKLDGSVDQDAPRTYIKEPETMDSKIESGSADLNDPQSDLQQVQDEALINSFDTFSSFDSSVFNNISVSKNSMIGEVTNTSSPSMTLDIVSRSSIPENNIVKRKSTQLESTHYRKRAKIFEDYLSSCDESNPSDSDYIPDTNSSVDENEENLVEHEASDVQVAHLFSGNVNQIHMEGIIESNPTVQENQDNKIEGKNLLASSNEVETLDEQTDLLNSERKIINTIGVKT